MNTHNTYQNIHIEKFGDSFVENVSITFGFSVFHLWFYSASVIDVLYRGDWREPFPRVTLTIRLGTLSSGQVDYDHRDLSVLFRPRHLRPFRCFILVTDVELTWRRRSHFFTTILQWLVLVLRCSLCPFI